MSETLENSDQSGRRFEDEPVKEVALLLQMLGSCIAKAALRDLAMDLEEAVSVAFPKKRVRGAVSASPNEEALEVLTYGSSKEGRLQKLSLEKRSVTVDAKSILERAFNSALGSHGDIEIWHDALRRYCDAVIEGDSSSALNQDLWQLAGDIAWRDESFQTEVSLLARSFFRDVAWIGGDDWLPRFSPNTFWLLIDCSGCLRKGKNVSSQSHANHPQHFAVDAQRQAMLVATQTEWAGFWDIWLLRRFEAARVKSGIKATSRLASIMRSIPAEAAETAGHRETTSKEKKPVGFEREDWLDEMPVSIAHCGLHFDKKKIVDSTARQEAAAQNAVSSAAS